jgi:hypothetical protein
MSSGNQVTEPNMDAKISETGQSKNQEQSHDQEVEALTSVYWNCPLDRFACGGQFQYTDTDVKKEIILA